MAARKAKRAAEAPEQPTTRKAEKVTIVLTSELASRMRAAVFYTPGLTVTGLVERAVVAEIGRLERNRGSSFDEPSGPLRRGRPVRLP